MFMSVLQPVLEAWVTSRCEDPACVHSTPGPAATRPPRPSPKCAPQTYQPGPGTQALVFLQGRVYRPVPELPAPSELRVTFTLICINKCGAPHFRILKEKLSVCH